MAVRGKVLIVEDDRAICNFMRRVLEANGYESIAVGTGREAISMLASHCPDVVILDLGLPDMDGMEVLEELRTVMERYMEVYVGKRFSSLDILESILEN